ncbi:MAG TPA: class I poly(R)-hydroxyalkanoic acid synthase [Burkholderiaceae bacterium]|nr:class I poly(R)-hydroxyalkanoic acid synthase [Burkholderiaceae bacterium]
MKTNPKKTATPSVEFDTAKLIDLQKQYVDDATKLWQQAWGNVASPSSANVPVSDRRFAADAWKNNPVAALTASAFLMNARALQGMADAVQTDDKTKARIRYAVEQFNAAASPSNYLMTNAEALQKAIDTQGESLNQGMKNLLTDVKQGHISMTDESQFEVGKNVATTEGAVVFENELFQLIEYKPLTKQVYERPFLLVPPCINKFYILDLQPDNSLIRYTVAQGHRTFVLSWRNPDESLAGLTWDDYIEDAAIKAITTVQAITGSKQINTLGFCVGGTILASALAVLAARGEKPAASLTLLTSMLDFTDTGILDIFIDEESVHKREMELADPKSPKLLKGQELATSFSFLRPNDLVWNYVVGNYLKGETPPAFDLLYWNSDSTNLPGPMYSWYLRNTYLENNLIKPGKTTVCGEKIDFNYLDMPTYIYGSQEDHIVPVGAAYASTQIVPGNKRFVMGASGHIAGVINPPSKNKRAYWTYEPSSKAGKSKKAQNAIFPATHAEWFEKSTQHPGSWWTDWSNWLAMQAGKKIPSPKAYGSGSSKGKYRAIEPAPGRYVKAKA